MNLFIKAAECLAETSVKGKITATNELYNNFADLSIHRQKIAIIRGIPENPLLVSQSELKARGVNTPQGHGALIHAIAHIEFSAVNLALDAVARFQDMPRNYYNDWLRIAYEECEHFTMLSRRLNKLGFSYGDFPAHDGLWQAALDTADDFLFRMAIVPRVLEAHGLDVTPAIIAKFDAIGDVETVEILQVIFRDEISHVAAGTRWFNFECARRGLTASDVFRTQLKKYQGNIPPPRALAERKQAGFSSEDIEILLNLAVKKNGKRAEQ